LRAVDRPLVMGILNVTPDSFSDGGLHSGVEAAVERAFAMKAEGVDILDVGGESTRPGAEPVDPEVEQMRVVPVLEALADAGWDLPVSVDTRRAQVAAAALEAGACMVNDVSALGDPEMAGVVAQRGVPVVLMHMRGVPGTMQQAPEYGDVVGEVLGSLQRSRDQAVAAGIKREQIILDPGIGFGKRTGAGVEDNLALLSGLPRFLSLGQPLLVGASRKRFIGNVTGAPLAKRLPGSLVAAMAAVWGGASVLRVHDVVETVQAVRLAAHLDPSLWRAWWDRSLAPE
jgi:dihydropteroate synthase